MDILQDIVNKNMDFLENMENFHIATVKDCDGYFKEIDNFINTGNIDFFKASMTGKENLDPIVPYTNKRKVCQKKPALADITENNTPLIPIKIKKEKTSDVGIFVKKEPEEMPAPTRLPPRKKRVKCEKIESPKRSTRSKTRTKNENNSNTGESENAKKNSDVIIQNTTITTIELSDNEKDTETESEKIEKNTDVRTTRSKIRKQTKQQSIDQIKNTKNDILSNSKVEKSTRTKRTKRARSNSVDEPAVATERKKSKSNSSGNRKSAPTEDINATYVASSKDSQGTSDDPLSINSTVIVENPIFKNDTERETKASPEPAKKPKGAIKQIFSPYDNTPLKKKIEAFEKLGNANASDKHTKTMTKKKDKYKEVLTPVTTKFQPKVCSTSMINKLHNNTSSYNESILSAKSSSALKASQAEFREREKRRQEKEREAMKKREALLQAQMEEKRRKREEKQQKAQLQREALEKEKARQLEMQHLKEEKLQKQKEEKRVVPKKNKQGEISKLDLKHKTEREQPLPVYMITRAPLLPTDDCYDSDDPEFETARRNEPYWSRDSEVGRQQMAIIVCGESIKNSFFCRQAHTPDLTEIFEHIDPRKLKRTSSAIWRKPPRYTLMPTFAERPMFSEESD